jgi:CRISPR system Cascade subunit CasD
LVSERFYLCDASFLAAVRAEATLVARLAGAVQSPVWPVYLGRKCCIPSLPVYEGLGSYPSLEAALESWPLGGGRLAAEGVVRGVVESMTGEGVRRRHAILSQSRRSFGPIYTREVTVSVSAAAAVAATEVQPQVNGKAPAQEAPPCICPV